MSCKELWIGCHVSCRKKALVMENTRFTTNVFDILVGTIGTGNAALVKFFYKLIFFMFSDRFDVLISKIILKNKKILF